MNKYQTVPRGSNRGVQTHRPRFTHSRNSILDTSVSVDVDDAESVIPMELRRHWSGLEELDQLKSIHHVIYRVVYRHSAETISIVRRDDRRAALMRDS